MTLAKTSIPLVFGWALVGCHGAVPVQMTPAHDPQYITGFDPPAAMPGYTRYVTPVIPAIAAGTDETRCQWLAAPVDHDLYVTTTMGQQSKGGHHVVLYATTVMEQVGTSRDCIADDNVSITFLGAIGGEGANTQSLPDHVVFVLPKGQALMANTHFINATTQPFDGQGVIDVKYVEKTAADRLANLFANIALSFDVPVGTIKTIDRSCTFPVDVSFFRLTNHMHNWGAKISSEVKRASGAAESLVVDDPWAPEQQFNFRFVAWPLDAPMTIKAGETVTTHCTWDNTAGSKALSFPDEMCVMFGYFLSDQAQSTYCTDGKWSN
jgi:hypothetical protein